MSASSVGLSLAAAISLALVAITYAQGTRRRGPVETRLATLRHGAFWAALVVLLLSLTWPLEGWAHRLFFVHQIGIIAARIVVPMLIVLSHPAGSLVAGLPRTVRARLLKPALIWRPGRHLWAIVSSPAVTLLAYVGALYLWEVPAMQAAILSSPLVDIAMHLSLLLVGLLFWGRIFERRPAPHGVTHGKRLMMIWIAILTQILLGAYLTVKTTILYPAYGAALHMGLMTPLADEETGGFLIWIPSGFLSLVALIGVIHLWGLHETRMDEKRKRWSPSNSAILLYPETARALRAMTRDKNRRLAIGLMGFVLLVFGAMMGFMGGAHRMNRRENMRLYALSKS
jgi:putative membrane protein